MINFIMIMLHIVALLVMPLALFVTIPLHIIALLIEKVEKLLIKIRNTLKYQNEG